MFNSLTGGWWFWTLKLEEPWNAGWSAMNATQAEILPKWLGTAFAGPPPPNQKDGMLQEAHSTSITLCHHQGLPDLLLTWS